MIFNFIATQCNLLLLKNVFCKILSKLHNHIFFKTNDYSRPAKQTKIVNIEVPIAIEPGENIDFEGMHPQVTGFLKTSNHRCRPGVV